jgi:hypothetical protein
MIWVVGWDTTVSIVETGADPETEGAVKASMVLLP